MGFFNKIFGGNHSSGKWTPRPFYANKIKEEYQDWFRNVPEWSSLDPRITSILIDRMLGKPAFELFMFISMELKLIPKYESLRSILDKGKEMEVAICPNVAQILYKSGMEQYQKTIEIWQKRPNVTPKDAERFKECCRNASFAFESAILVEPDFLPPYVNFAILKNIADNQSEAQKLCEQGLDRVTKMRATPLPAPNRADLEKTEAVLRGLLAEIQKK